MKDLSVKRRTLAFMLSLLAVNPSHAFFGVGDVVFDPNHTAQTIAAEAARAADAARQIQVELNQYQMMVRNAISLGDPIFSPLGNTLRSLYSTYMQAQSISYRLQNLDQEFGMNYPGYYTYLSTMGQGSQTFPAKYKAWSEQSSESVRRAISSSGMKIDEMETDQGRLQTMIQRSGTSVGRLQAIQAGNEIAAEQVRQLQKLQLLAYDNIKMQADYIAIERDRMAMDDAFRSNYRSAPPRNSPGQEF